MLKVIIDTNVLISAFIQRSYPYYILNKLFAEDKFALSISDDLIQEYHEVIHRRKFSRYPDVLISAENMLGLILVKATTYYPSIELNIIVDKDDNKLLELADVCKAGF